MSHLLEPAARDEADRLDQVADLIRRPAIGGDADAARVAVGRLRHVGPDEAPVQHVAAVRHPALDAVAVLLRVLGQAVDGLLDGAIDALLLRAGDDLQHPPEVPLGERDSALLLHELVDVAGQLAGGQLLRQELGEDVLPGGLLQVLAEPVAAHGRALNGHLQAQVLAEEAIEDVVQARGGLHLLVVDPAGLDVAVHDVPAAAVGDQPLALGLDVVGAEEEAVELVGVAAGARLGEPHHADADPSRALRIGEALTQVLGAAVGLDQVGQLALQAAAVAIDRVPVAQGDDLAARRRNLPGVEDVPLVRREGRVHADQVDVADSMSLQPQEV